MAADGAAVRQCTVRQKFQRYYFFAEDQEDDVLETVDQD